MKSTAPETTIVVLGDFNNSGKDPMQDSAALTNYAATHLTGNAFDHRRGATLATCGGVADGFQRRIVKVNSVPEVGKGESGDWRSWSLGVGG